MAITVVSGAPCAGKTTYIADNRETGDVVVDLDAIAAALGGGNEGPVKTVAFAARAAAIDCILAGIDGNAWIVDTHMRPDSRARYADAGAQVVVLDPGMDVCLARAGDRPPGTDAVIRDWYAAQAGDAKRFRAMRDSALKLAARYPDRLDEILSAVRSVIAGP